MAVLCHTHTHHHPANRQIYNSIRCQSIENVSLYNCYLPFLGNCWQSSNHFSSFTHKTQKLVATKLKCIWNIVAASNLRMRIQYYNKKGNMCRFRCRTNICKQSGNITRTKAIICWLCGIHTRRTKTRRWGTTESIIQSNFIKNFLPAAAHTQHEVGIIKSSWLVIVGWLVGWLDWQQQKEHVALLLLM